MQETYDVIVVGFGAAALSAVLSAVETAEASQQRDIRISVVERASIENRGGNTRWSTATFRMKDVDTINDDFVEAFGPVTRDSDAYVQELARRAPETIRWVESKGLDFNQGSAVFMTSDDPRIAPTGAGAAIVETLANHVDNAARGLFFGPDNQMAVGVDVRYETTAVGLVLDDVGSIAGLRVRTRSGRLEELRAHTVVIASGGFQGNPEMMTRYLGFDVPPISLGGRHNRGEATQMALAVGAKPAGQWSEFHPLPADPRTATAKLLTFAALMETVPYSIMVNKAGERFMDEGANSMDYLYDVLGRAVQGQKDQLGFAVFDDQVMGIPGYQKAIAKDQAHEPYQSETIEGLAGLIGVPAAKLEATVAAFNAAVPASGEFLPTAKDGLSTDSNLDPPKSNWARPINRPPFYAYPVTCASVFTFGGIGTNERAEVVDTDDTPIAGLYAAGEVTGLYHHDYVGATSVLRALVFGRVAGRNAVDHALRQAAS